MKLQTTDKHNRILLATCVNGGEQLEIAINYTGHSSGDKAVKLDGQVIPRIIAAVNRENSHAGGHAKIIVFVHQGVCSAVWSTQPVETEIIDLDGDYRKEGFERLEALKKSAEDLGEHAEYLEEII